MSFVDGILELGCGRKGECTPLTAYGSRLTASDPEYKLREIRSQERRLP